MCVRVSGEGDGDGARGGCGRTRKREVVPSQARAQEKLSREPTRSTGGGRTAKGINGL